MYTLNGLLTARIYMKFYEVICIETSKSLFLSHKNSGFPTHEVRQNSDHSNYMTGSEVDEEENFGNADNLYKIH